MADAVIVSTARTAMSKSVRGLFNNTHGITLAGHALKHAIERAGVDPAEVEDVILGCAYPEGATGFNIGRNAAMAAGCPSSTAGMTVNRYCSSGLQAIALAAGRVLNEGVPIILKNPRHPISKAYDEIANNLIRIIRDMNAEYLAALKSESSEILKKSSKLG